MVPLKVFYLARGVGFVLISGAILTLVWIHVLELFILVMHWNAPYALWEKQHDMVTAAYHVALATVHLINFLASECQTRWWWTSEQVLRLYDQGLSPRKNLTNSKFCVAYWAFQCLLTSNVIRIFALRTHFVYMCEVLQEAASCFTVAKQQLSAERAESTTFALSLRLDGHLVKLSAAPWTWINQRYVYFSLTHPSRLCARLHWLIVFISFCDICVFDHRS